MNAQKHACFHVNFQLNGYVYPHYIVMVKGLMERCREDGLCKYIELCLAKLMATSRTEFSLYHFVHVIHGGHVFPMPSRHMEYYRTRW